jgi:hypothetical protein
MTGRSSRKVPYDLRPAKQIERRMLLDALHILSNNGFQLRDYQYTGMGSIYFVDFILLYKLLGIKRLVSAESDETIADRITFNVPYADVVSDMRTVGDVVADLDRDILHLVWMDYDFQLNGDVIRDILTASQVLSPGSILLVTVDVEPPVENGNVKSWRAYYESQVMSYLGAGWGDDDFGQSALPHTNAQILFNAIEKGLASRTNVEFLPLFNFSYADGHAMLTVGGMIGTEKERRRLSMCDFLREPFMRLGRSDQPFEIHVPKLTRKERLYLDQFMPCSDEWQPKEFSLPKADVLAYREIYRYYPAFAELLV